MKLIDRIEGYAEDLTGIRRDLHAHPELGFEEVRTSGVVANLLESWGIKTHREIGKTGVVGIIEGARAGRTIGLRADMDALPIEEETNLPYRSTNPGVMHACGHDGHTTMLLGAARYLAETRDFAGKVVLIFQPAEEGLGGARAMLADGLFERFPCDEVYGLHNWPGAPQNRVGILPGVAMAGADFFDIRVIGRGSHGARPHDSRDPLLAASALVQALQSIVSRNLDPQDAAVVSVTQFHSGAAYNVIPNEAVISGTARMFTDEVRAHIRTRIQDIADGVAAAHGVTVEVDIRDIFTPLVNNAQLSEDFADIARDVVGDENVLLGGTPVTGSEDFADMLNTVPGAYFTIGHEGTAALHNPGFTFDDSILPLGSTLLARIVESRSAAEA
ncbi:M20 aminoacylase family protein [Marimonas arenosa]|uniref:M20 family metallopeptidase n=1 Tax=Marimonas arenosa TaxID=1795305 RepID=A0AAE3WBV3_9RHOB|nr:M20 aminoacylase family protein [Marimonas arenosa]MDQ2089847.1 M20 family metallopeptidase [Marimonas arenosa]